MITVCIASRDGELTGELTVPSPVQGIAVIASGRSGHAERDRAVARSLHAVGWGTLLLGLLTGADQGLDPAGPPPDDEGLRERLADGVDWLVSQPRTSGLPVALVATAADSGPVLAAAAARPGLVESVVLISAHASGSVPVEDVRAPVLLVCVAGDEAARAASGLIAERLRVPCRVQEIPAADRLFTRPDDSGPVARAAAAWLQHPSSRVTAA